MFVISYQCSLNIIIIKKYYKHIFTIYIALCQPNKDINKTTTTKPHKTVAYVSSDLQHV